MSSCKILQVQESMMAKKKPGAGSVRPGGGYCFHGGKSSSLGPYPTRFARRAYWTEVQVGRMDIRIGAGQPEIHTAETASGILGMDFEAAL
jgi:hypothetical protein